MYRAVKCFVASLALCATVTLAAPAFAQDANGPGLTAVNAKRNRMPSNETWTAEYYSKVGGKPQWGPEGSVIQLFSGSRGDGAIVWTPQTGAHFVFGAFLDYLMMPGRIKQLGFPVNDPIRGPGDGCSRDDTLLRQTFARIVPDPRNPNTVSTSATTMCWGPNGAFPGILIGL